jgi:mannan endo-1,4-beta-mannosidase
VKLMRILTIGVAIIAAVAVIVVAGRHDKSAAAKSLAPAASHPVTLPVKPATYLGMYAPGVPVSYAGVAAFTKATGVRPDVVVWYIGWLEPFQASFAAKVVKDRAVPLIQMDPRGISLAAIASGRYDGYLSSYAEAVNTYGRPVIMSFGHEMNGSWYSWGYRHSSPTAFVAAWRHIVTLFRTVGAANVTWLWTVNIIHPLVGIPSPGPWWPGSAYVTWVGIDGYYTNSSQTFASLFGPTIVSVRTLTSDPILLAETGVSPTDGQPAKIADLFAGIRTYGLLGFAWFDAIGQQDWRIRSPAAVAAFRKGADTFTGPRS